MCRRRRESIAFRFRYLVDSSSEDSTRDEKVHNLKFNAVDARSAAKQLLSANSPVGLKEIKVGIKHLDGELIIDAPGCRVGFHAEGEWSGTVFLAGAIVDLLASLRLGKEEISFSVAGKSLFVRAKGVTMRFPAVHLQGDLLPPDLPLEPTERELMQLCLELGSQDSAVAYGLTKRLKECERHFDEAISKAFENLKEYLKSHVELRDAVIEILKGKDIPQPDASSVISNGSKIEDAFNAAELELAREGSGLSWIRKSGLTERAYLFGIMNGLNSVSGGSLATGLGSSRLMNTLYAREADDSFFKTDAGKVFRDGCECVDTFGGAGPDRFSARMTEVLSDLESSWNARMKEAKEATNACRAAISRETLDALEKPLRVMALIETDHLLSRRFMAD